MPALNFSAQFAEAVASGEKAQTIRKLRKRPIQVGDRLHLYTEERTNACRKLGEATCILAVPICILARITESQIPLWMRDDLARLDGFASWADLVVWFDATHGLPFEGVLIRWRLDGGEDGAA